MERLTSKQTIKHADGTTHIETYCHGHRYGPAAFPHKYGTSEPQEYKNYCEVIDRLAAYEDAEEQGMTVRLPCRKGDRLFVLNAETPTGIEETKCFKVQVMRNGIPRIFARCTYDDWGNAWMEFLPSDFDKIMFLDREKALAAKKP